MKLGTDKPCKDKNPGEDNPWTGQILKRMYSLCTMSERDKAWTGQMLDETKHRRAKPWKEEPQTEKSPGQNKQLTNRNT
jgi:hypothetical protein